MNQNELARIQKVLENQHFRRLQTNPDEDPLRISDETLQWVKCFSSKFRESKEEKDACNAKNESWHGSGHKDSDAAGSTTAFMLMSTIVLFLTCLYMLWRVFK